MQHVIKKQTIELDIDKRLNAFHTQHNMSEHYWNVILQKLEKIFDHYSDENETLEFDSMEIDLGVYSEQQLEKGTRELEPLLHEQLQKYFQTPSKKVVQTIHRSLNICMQWLHHMKTGHLPWNTLEVDNGWYEQVLEALATDIPTITQLREAIVSYPHAVKRLYYQHDQTFLERFESEYD